MKRHLLLLLVFVGVNQLFAQRPLRCGNELIPKEENVEELLLEKKASVVAWKEQRKQTATLREDYVIPVVVHILYAKDSERLSEAQIRSQIEVLNEDFNARNDDTNLIPSEFRDLKANVGFTFCLVDIIYKSTNECCIANIISTKGANNRAKVFYSDEGGSDPWDPVHYLNIWVGNTGENILGQTPSLNLAYPQEDGVVIDYNAFGLGRSEVPFHLGRTTTHEIGHYFGLSHIFLGSSCTDDGIDDTPIQSTSYDDCPSYPQSSCGTRDMFMNFMDYVDDECMKLFTVEQKSWMIFTLETERTGLLDFENCEEDGPSFETEIRVFPNPTQEVLFIDLDKQISSQVTVRLFDARGQLFYESKSNGNFIRPISTAKLSTGVYFLRLEYDEGKETKKILVVK